MKRSRLRETVKCAVNTGIPGLAQDRSKLVLVMVALASFGLMLVGFADAFLQNGWQSAPGPATLTFGSMEYASHVSKSMLAMSAGILLFIFLPSLRVLLGLKQFVRKHELFNALIALLVLIELVISIFM